MGPIVNRKQRESVRDGIAQLREETTTVFEGDDAAIDADDPSRGAFVMPLLLASRDVAAASAVHDVEVFGPVSTILPYESLDEAVALVARGRGSLVTSIVTADPELGTSAALRIAPSNGRVVIFDDSVRKASPGHGAVMPSCLHGGPGRAGGGEELGGLRGLAFYLQRAAIQGPEAQIRLLAEKGVTPTA